MTVCCWVPVPVPVLELELELLQVLELELVPVLELLQVPALVLELPRRENKTSRYQQRDRRKCRSNSLQDRSAT